MAQSRRRGQQGNGSQQRRARGTGATKGGGGGLFFLFIFAMIACAGAAYVLFPDKVMEFLGQKDPTSEQPKEVVHKDDEPDDTLDRENKPAIDDEPDDKPDQKPVVDDKPDDKPEIKDAPTFPDQSEASGLLADANQAYRTLEWTKARSSAGKVLQLDAKPATKSEARSIISRSRELQDFMKSMTNPEYGMNQGIYTTDAVAQITYQSGSTELVVPVKSMDDKTIINTDDPVNYIQKKLDAGRAYVMNEKGIPAEIKPNMIIGVDSADMRSKKEELSQQAAEKYMKVQENPLLKTDAVALYDVARFAYEVGATKPVTQLLERALILDPNLATSVRNDRAQESYEKIVRALKSGSKNSAAGHLRYMRKHYEDTSVFREAEAYYKGNSEELAKQMRANREAKRRAIEEGRRKRREQAKKAGDTEIIEQLDEIESQEKKTEEKLASASSGSMADADAKWEKGQEYIRLAFADGADRAGKKDAYLKQAVDVLVQAKASYIAMSEKGNAEAAKKAAECNRDLYTAKKFMRP